MVKEKIIPGLGLTAKEFKSIETFRKSKNSAVLTIMFTDIQGFTSLTEERGESYVHKLHGEHDKIVVECVEHGGAGIVIKYIGDSIMAIFSEPTAAVERALQIQKKLHDFNGTHPEFEDIHVRIGLHMGQTVLENKMHVDLFGRHVNKASRIESLAEGGHILISYPVFDSVKSWLIEAEHADYKHHGQYLLKGIEKPEDIYEVYNINLTIPKAPKNGKKNESNRTYMALGSAALICSLLLLFLMIRARPFVAEKSTAIDPVEQPAGTSLTQDLQDQQPVMTEPADSDTGGDQTVEKIAPRQIEKPEVFFISLNALEPVLDVKTPLSLAKVEGSDTTKKALTPIPPGRHVIHFVVSDLVYYFYEFDVTAGQNFLPAKFVRSELPGAQINLFLQDEDHLEETRTARKDYFYFTKDNLEKVVIEGKAELSVTGTRVSTEATRFTIEYSLILNGTEVANKTLIIDSPMNSSESTRSEPVLIHEDPYHQYLIRYFYRNDSIQVNLDASFKELM